MRVVGAAAAAVDGPRAAAVAGAGVIARNPAVTAAEAATIDARHSVACRARHALVDGCNVVATPAPADRLLRRVGHAVAQDVDRNGKASRYTVYLLAPVSP